jgi:CubicO group peptidase (beta-lactamase class C family)
LFDLASLTKPVVATLAVVLDERGQLPLDRTIGEIFRARTRGCTSAASASCCATARA